MTEPRMSEAQIELLETLATWSGNEEIITLRNRVIQERLAAQAERDAAAKLWSNMPIFGTIDRGAVTAASQPPTESEVMPYITVCSVTGLHTTTPPPPQLEGASRRERLCVILMEPRNTVEDLADAILADLAAPLSEAEVERISEAAAAQLGKGPDTTDLTRDAELGRLVRRMVHLKRIIKMSHHLGLGGAPIFSAANIFGPESGLGNTLDEAVAALVAKLGDDGHG